MGSWKKSPPDLVERFGAAAASLPGVQHRPMFGYPAIFLKGHLAAGLFQDRIILRLSEEDRREFLKLPGARPFEPMKGRPMKEYVEAPGSLATDPGAIGRWLERAARFVQTLPAKPKKGGSGPKSKAPKPRKRT